jgi:hypothetical protein
MDLASWNFITVRFPNLLRSFTKAGQIMASFFCFRPDESNRSSETRIILQERLVDCRHIPSWAAIALLIGSLTACSSNPESLSIKMVNPQTQMTLMCSARDDIGTDRAVLATVVETCARQLEARGFVRTK